MWLAIGALCAGLLLRSEYEKEQLVTEVTAAESGKLEKDCRIVFLSDLHDHLFGKDNVRLLAAVEAAKPDLVLVGGDMMVAKGKADTEISLSLMAKLARHYPIYYGNGNHENRMCRETSVYGRRYQEYVSDLEALGIRVLGDKTEYFRRDMAVTGVDLPEECYRKFRPATLGGEDIKKRVGSADGERFQILLCHSPLYFHACTDWGADLTLCGHFHGGTIRLPYLGGVMTPQYQFFLPWCAGEFEENGKRMVVSRGLGTHSINIRLNDKPQVVVVDLKAKS